MKSKNMVSTRSRTCFRNLNVFLVIYFCILQRLPHLQHLSQSRIRSRIEQSRDMHFLQTKQKSLSHLQEMDPVKRSQFLLQAFHWLRSRLLLVITPFASHCAQRAQTSPKTCSSVQVPAVHAMSMTKHAKNDPKSDDNRILTHH